MKMTRGRSALTHFILILFVIWSLTPVVWTFLTSLKPESQIFTTQVKLFADPPTLENYETLLTRGDFLRWGANSLFVAFMTTIAGVLLASTCAYALSRFRFRGRGPALYIFLVAQMFPAIILLVPLYSTFTSLGLLDTPWALVLSYSTINTVPVQLAKYVTATAGTLYGVQAALAVVAMVPLIIGGYLIQSHLARGMTFGAVKR
jgi:ABC-type glycerol-3-phosphate transport system permease component